MVLIRASWLSMRKELTRFACKSLRMKGSLVSEGLKEEIWKELSSPVVVLLSIQSMN